MNKRWFPGVIVLGLILAWLTWTEGGLWQKPIITTQKAEEARVGARFIDLTSLLGYENIVPVLVIGSGPAGLGAALHAARDNKFPLVIMGDEPGGLLTKTGEIENWLGMPTLVGEVAMDQVTQQVAHYGAQFLHDTVIAVDTDQWPFKVSLSSGMTLYALSIVIATGAHSRTLNIPGEQESWGYGLSTCAKCDAWAYKNKEVVVIGGGDSAIEEAIQLSQHARKVTIFVRSGHMRATAHMQERLSAYENISVVYNTIVQEIIRTPGQDRSVGHVKLCNTENNDTSLFATDGVFLAIGHVPSTELFKGKIDLDDQGYIIVRGRTQQTLTDGIFAAGDVADKVYRQATYAAGMGVAAGIEASHYLDEIGFTPAVIRALEQHQGQCQLKQVLIQS